LLLLLFAVQGILGVGSSRVLRASGKGFSPAQYQKPRATTAFKP
jgi:hypothetical protein